MSKNLSFALGLLWLSLPVLTSQAAGTPRLEFEKTTIDFGKVSQVATVTGVFKFKNTGDGILKLQPPKPSCGCTVAELKPDTLAPGESGELPFTLNLGIYRAILEKHIAVTSNDPKTPEIGLSIKVDYTPLYELLPVTVSPNLAFGVNQASEVTTLTRNDGKPLRIVRMATSKPWIQAALEPGAPADAASAKIRISIEREGTPRRFNEYVHIYAAGETNTPVSSIYLYGQMMGEVSLTPEALYWSVNTVPAPGAERPESLVVRRIAIRSAAGQPLVVSKARSSIPGMTVELVEKEPGKAFELVARLDAIPAATVSGVVSFDTSVASQSHLDVPVVVNVFKP
jgi:hypothetical protein